MTRFTWLGRVFLVIAVLLYGASLTSQSGLLLFLVGVILGCFLVNFRSSRGTLKGIDLKPPMIAHLAEGQRLMEPWEVRNTGRAPAWNIEVATLQSPLLQAAEVPAGGSVHLVPDLFFARRGAYPLSSVRLSTAAPFGLIASTRTLELQGEIVVHPAVYECGVPRSRGYDVMVGGKHKGQRHATSGSSFAGVRPFQSGDSFKSIHWQSSAKGQGWMVRTFDEELAGRVAVIIAAGPGDAEVLDDAVRAAGSLIFAALDAGHHVELIDLHQLETLTIPPFSDGIEVLERLARVEPAPTLDLLPGLHTALERLSRKDALHVVLTSGPGEEMLGAAIQDGRALSVYLPESISEIQVERVHGLGGAGVEIFRYTRDALLPS